MEHNNFFGERYIINSLAISNMSKYTLENSVSFISPNRNQTRSTVGNCIECYELFRRKRPCILFKKPNRLPKQAELNLQFSLLQENTTYICHTTTMYTSFFQGLPT